MTPLTISARDGAYLLIALAIAAHNSPIRRRARLYDQLAIRIDNALATRTGEPLAGPPDSTGPTPSPATATRRPPAIVKAPGPLARTTRPRYSDTP